MPDPLEPLRHLDEGSVPGALPAAEVRRRGDRMRRRRTTLRVIGAACAVAVVVTGGVALGDGRPDASPAPPVATRSGDPTPDWTLGPSPSPDDGTPPATGSQARTVPEGFPLMAGVPAVDGDSSRKPVVTDRGTPRVFDPCHNNEQAAVERDRTDYREVTQQGPAQAYVREIVVYADSSAAHEAMLLARGELERCRVYAYDDGISRDVWEVSPVTPDDVPADQSLVAVNHGYADYGVTTLATHWIVARVGNAVLSVGYDGEFGATAGQVRDVAKRELASYEAIVPAMCPFADARTDLGCDESQAPGPGPVSDPGPAFLLDEQTLREQTGLEALRTVPDSQTATLPCQAEWLTTFRADTADYRQFEARDGGGEGELAAWAGTAVLGFPSELAAGTAYDTVGEWLSQCEPQVDTGHRLVTVVDGGIGEPHITRLPDGIMSWRGVKLTAPERCVECDAAWDDHEGIAQVGRHLVLVHVALGGDMQFGVDDTRFSLDGLLAAAADLVRTHGDDTTGVGASPGARGTALLGPDGYGPLALGMTAVEAEGTGIVTLEDGHGDGCTAFGILSDDRTRSVGSGYLAPGKGVVAIDVDRGIETPQGIHVGSGVTAVKRAYAHLTGGDTWTTAPASDTAEYVMRFEGEKVAELALATTGQHCLR